MKKSFSLAGLGIALTIVLATVTGCSKKADSFHYSIFCHHIETIAEQEGISFAEAAAKIKDLGYAGADIDIWMSDENLAVLHEQGFIIPCGYCTIDFANGDCGDQEAKSLDRISSIGLGKLLLIPGFIDEDFSEEEYQAMVGRIGSFIDKAAKIGCSVLVEDYDSQDSPCYNIERLSNLFEDIPSLGHVFDSGNYIFAGDDALVALDKFMPRISHIHFKDRVSESDMKCPAIGSGVIPFEEIMTKLHDASYDGWIAVEHFGSEHMLDDAASSIEFLRSL